MISELHGSGGGGGGKGGGGDSSRTPVEAPNTLRSAATARILDLIGEGPIVGLANGLKSVFLDDTQLQNSDGSFNFRGVTVDTRLGESVQSSIKGFPSVENEVDVSTQVKRNLPIVRTVSNLDTDAVRVKIRVPALTSQNKENGDIKGGKVVLYVDIRPDGGSWVRGATITISGKTTSPYERQTRVSLIGNGPWNIRVTRATADSNSAAIQNDTYWSSYTEIIDRRLMYPDSALVGLTVDARQFGSSVPKRAYDIKGRIIRVPNNYNPSTREYTGFWDGSFKLAWTDNPAWVYYDLATHPRYGAGIENVDKLELYQIGQYCDQLVPDGYGSVEPRFTINTVLADREEAITALNYLASVFRGMSFWGSNTVVPVADRPTDPVKLVTPANVIDGEFDLSGSSLKDRHSVVAVTWNDPENNYSKQIELVEDQDAIRQFGWRQIDITAFGCTSRGQAHRLGKWLLYSEQYETTAVTYSAGTDHADLRPGDIIQVTDPSWAGARLHGRLKVSGTTVLTLDKVPEDVIGSEVWYLDVILPTGKIERRTVVNFEGNTVTLDSALSAKPVDAAIWVLSSIAVEPRQFRVTSVAEKESQTYEISAVEFLPGKYDFVEQGLALPERETSLVPTGPLPTPLNITVDEYLYKSGVAVVSGATISITPVNDSRVSLYEYEVIRPEDSDYTALSVQPGVIADLPNTIPGEYQIRVRSVSSSGLRSPWRVTSAGLQGLLRPPADVADLRLSINSGQIFLTWPAVPDLDLDRYEIRYSPAVSGATWSNSQIAIERVSASVNTAILPSRKGTYLIRAVDTSGIYSLNATLATSEIAEIESYNVVEVVDEAPAWLGVKDQTVNVSGRLQLVGADFMSEWNPLSSVVTMSYGVNGLTQQGWYYADEVVDMGDVYTARLTGEVLAFGFDILGTMASWSSLTAVDRLSDTDAGQWSVEMQVSKSFTPAPASPTDWTSWEPLTVGEYTARAFRFRLQLNSLSPAITPSVGKFTIIVDVPDRVDGKNNLTCPVGGVRVNFSPAFMVRPALAVDAQGLDVADRKSITSVDNAGFFVEFFDSAGVSVERTFDYLAKGYGRKN